MGIVIQFGTEDNGIYVSRRLAIGVAILIMFLVHFAVQILAYFATSQNVHKHKLDHLSKRLYLYTIACLISYNYLQGGVFEAILAWFSLLVGIVLHATVFKNFDKPELENKLWVFYYFMIWVYFLGIIISFYSN